MHTCLCDASGVTRMRGQGEGPCALGTTTTGEGAINQPHLNIEPIGGGDSWMRVILLFAPDPTNPS